MVERPEYQTLGRTENKKLLLQRLPQPLVACFVTRVMRKGLTPQEQDKLRGLVRMALKGKPMRASLEVPPVYESQRSTMVCEGTENIPTCGSTIIIGNHQRGGPFYDMGQYFEIARVVYEQRTEENDDDIREPYAIMQRDITSGNPISRFFTGQFRELFARSIGWEVVSLPKFDQSRQIINSQRLPESALDRLHAGGAMILLPQGKYSTDLEFPQKGGNFLYRLREDNIQLVPLRIIGRDWNHLDLVFGKPVHIQELPVREGSIDINGDFVQKHIAPLGI